MSRTHVLIVSLAIPFVFAGGAPVHAQETKSPSILEFLGLKPNKPKEIQKRTPKKASAKKNAKLQKPKSGRKKASSNTKPAELLPGQTLLSPDVAGLPATPEKLPDAKTILVVGDFMADGVSEGIEQAFEGDAGVIVVSKANGSSGFIRDDFYSWPNEIAGIVAQTKPSVITVMIGTNDRQPLRLNGEKAAVRSAPWIGEYEKRVVAFTDALKATGVPVVWVGLPPFKQPGTSADMLALNDIYRKNTERVSGTFVDIWDGFLDDQGAFSINGSDYIGQPARLRASDGTNLTFPGKRKAAFFAEKPLRLALGNVGVPNATAFNPFNLPGPKLLTQDKPLVITHVAPVSLFDPAFDGDTELLGGEGLSAKSAGTKSPAQKLYVEGVASTPLTGRVDAPSAAVTP
ncbi:MAG: SGNH/GDSL hydrolase family protein [Rhizobiaceae bacterium]